jgi:ribosome-binding protein aMBF1 (putative translation factor)
MMASPRSSSQTHGMLVADTLAGDPAFREEWERLAFARAVAAKVIAYRADHGLSQTALARTLGIPQPQLARLEAAQHQPSDAMLRRLTTLGMEFTINYAPAGRQPRQLTRKARENVVAQVRTDSAVVRYTAA